MYHLRDSLKLFLIAFFSPKTSLRMRSESLDAADWFVLSPGADGLAVEVADPPAASSC